MPNPVTRFGRGFHGFAPRVTNFGPYEGDPNAPKGSAKYNLWRDGYYDSRGNPHRPGDIALTPDLARKYRYGDTVTEGGVTGRFTDVTNSRLSNRVDVWQATLGGGKQPAVQSRTPPPARAPEPQAPTRLLASDEWQTSPGDRRFLPPEGSGRPSTERSAMLTTDPNEDWIGAEPAGNNERTATGRSPSLITDPNDDWTGTEPAAPTLFANKDAGYEAVSPTLSGETYQYLANEPYKPAPQPAPSASPVFADEWWKSPSEMGDTGTGLTADAGDIWGEKSIFGSADTATGQAWDALASGGSDEGSHAFEFIQDDNQPLQFAREGGSQPTEDEPTYPEPRSETIIPDTIYDETPLLTEQQEPPPAEERYTFGEEPVPFTRNWNFGTDTGGRPEPSMFAFGLPAPSSRFDAPDDGTSITGESVDTSTGAVVERGGSTTFGESDTFNDAPGVVGSQGSVDTGYGPMGVLNYTGPRVADASTQWTKDPQLGWVPKAQAAPPRDFLNPTQYAHATFGGLTPTGYRDTRGSNVSDSHAQNLAVMGWAADAGPANFRQPDEVTQFYGGVWQLDDQGQPVRVGERVSGYRRPTQKAIVGRTINGRPWNASVPAGRGG